MNDRTEGEGDTHEIRSSGVEKVDTKAIIQKAVGIYEKKRVDDEKSGTKERKEMSVVMYTEVWDINLASDRLHHMMMQSLSLSFLESP